MQAGLAVLMYLSFLKVTFEMIFCEMNKLMPVVC